MGTKLKVMLFWVALGFALVLTLGLSAFVFAAPNESFNLSGELSFEPPVSVVKYYWGEMDNASGADSYYNQHIKLFSNNTFEAQIDGATSGMSMLMIYRGTVTPTSEGTFQETLTYVYELQESNGEVVMEFEWNEGEEVPEGMEFASMLNELHICENIAFFGDYPPMFEDSYVPSGSDVPIGGYLSGGRRSNVLFNSTGQETVSQIETNGHIRIALDRYSEDQDYRNLANHPTHIQTFNILQLDGQEVTDDTVVSLGYHTAEVSFEYNSQTYTMTVDFITSTEPN